MGCCFSSKSLRTRRTPPPRRQHLTQNQPPRVLVLEEETVKEVTHITVPVPPPLPGRQLLGAQVTGNQKEIAVEEEEVTTTTRTLEVPVLSHSHQASETCSIAETVDSTATSTVSANRGGGGGGDDEAISKRQMVYKGRSDKLTRSSSGKVQVTRKRQETGNGNNYNKNVGNERESRSRGRLSGPGEGGQMAGRRVAASRRDGVGERSGRRSRSPATGRAAGGGVGRGVSSSSPAGKTATGRGSVRLVGDGAVKKERENKGGSAVGQRPRPDAEEGRSGNQGGELLVDDNNPLVSLECFIFL